jgi:hypothetical protein
MNLETKTKIQIKRMVTKMTTINIDLKTIETEAKKYKDLEDCKKQLRSIQSLKCRLLKQKDREDYETEFAKLVLKEQIAKEVRSYLEPKKITVTTITAEQISVLTFDETIKAIKSIQSKKCNEQYNSDKTEYNKALIIEQQLLDHKALTKPIEDTVIQKSRINDLINQIETMDIQITKEYILEQLSELLV